jgi:serine phosphatase RsbU (regulator of sigma subunit)
MEDLTVRINYALAREEVRAERFANIARLTLLGILTVIAVFNASGLTFEANAMNFGALAVGYSYGLFVSLQIARNRYRPYVKYLTSCIDILVVMLVLFLYTRIENPAVALKNYVFLIAFPLIGLTALRYDFRLTATAGATALLSYVCLFVYLTLTNSIQVELSGYSDEMFSSRVTIVGQATKILIFAGYVVLVAFMARYSRRLMERLVRQEIAAQRENELMERELEIAAQVQDQLLPQEFPQVGTLSVYGKVEPGRFVGGDYCDFIRMGDERLLVAVADVSGKGVPAALIMAEVRAATHLLASMNLTLVEFAERLNDLLRHSTERKTFVTFFAGIVDTESGMLNYVNAGHPPPLAGRDGRLSPLGRGTIPLGIMSTLPQCTVRTEPFPRGSWLVCYTDGVLERRDAQGEEYGEERLVNAAQRNFGNQAIECVNQLLAEVKGFGEGRELDDDLTIAVVHWA